MNTLATPPKLMTVEEFWDVVHRLKNAERSFELVRGEAIELSRPIIALGVACPNIARIIGNFAFAKGEGCVVANDAGIILQRGPDTEVLSPNDRAGDLNARIADKRLAS